MKRLQPCGVHLSVTCSMLRGGREDVGLAPVTVALRWMPSRVLGRIRRTLAGDAVLPGTFAPLPATVSEDEGVEPLTDRCVVESGRKLSSSVSLSLSIAGDSSRADGIAFKVPALTAPNLKTNFNQMST